MRRRRSGRPWQGPRHLASLGLLSMALAVATADAQTLRDCADCPELQIIEPGSFRMGSAEDEAGRADDGREGPQRQVRITRRFALARHEVTVGEFKRFVAATGHVTTAEQPGPEAGCIAWRLPEANFVRGSATHWRAPGYEQGDDHPVVCVSWHDAQAYVRWLGARSGQAYRLPSEAEWEFAARAGSRSSRPWGDSAAQACRHANVADETTGPAGFAFADRHACHDGHLVAAPVGRYAPNAWGLYDMLGNVWEWVQDCYDKASYAAAEAPTDGSAHEGANCAARGVRGGSWFSGPTRARAAYRGGYAPDSRFNLYGFRVARSLP